MENIYNIYSNKKKIIVDVFLNIFAVALPIVMLQLIIYPKIAKTIGGQEYGLMLTIYSIWMVLPYTFGNVLNNIKLLKLPAYERHGKEGDIALLLRQWLIINSVTVFFVVWLYCKKFVFVHVVAGTTIAFLILLKAYLEVGFRIKLDYKAVLLNNTLLCTGYFIGFLIFNLTGVWEIIFLFGYLLSCIFCILKTKLLKEEPRKTLLYNNVKKDAYSLIFSVVIKNLTSYADKLLLYPLMGGLAVSIYYTATIVGKITGMLAGPINSVILSYIARWDKSKAKIFSRVLFIGAMVSVTGYVVVILLAKPIIRVLFPQWLDAVMDIMPFTTVTVMLGILISILQPFVLKFCKMKWQIIINMVGSFTYFSSALILWNFMGLKGFCIGTIIGALVKLFIMIGAFYKSVGNFLQT